MIHSADLYLQYSNTGAHFTPSALASIDGKDVDFYLESLSKNTSSSIMFQVMDAECNYLFYNPATEFPISYLDYFSKRHNDIVIYSFEKMGLGLHPLMAQSLNLLILAEKTCMSVRLLLSQLLQTMLPVRLRTLPQQIFRAHLLL